MADDPLRVAVVGAGRMGSVHIDAFSRSSRCVVTAVVEPDDARRRRASSKVAAVYSDVSEMLAARAADSVAIATPATLHLEIIAEVAAAGLPIFCEKPCGTGVSQASAALEITEREVVPLQVGFWRRFVPELDALQRRNVAGEFGRLSLISSHQWDHQPPSPEFRRLSGGIGPDMAVHEIDQLRWLTGTEIESLTAVRAGGDDPEDLRDPDGAVVLARLSDGAAAVITMGRRFPEQDSCWLELYADNGYERIPFMWGEDSERAFMQGLTAQADAFAGVVAGEPQLGATAADAVAALRTAALVGESLAGSAQGVWVR